MYRWGYEIIIARVSIRQIMVYGKSSMTHHLSVKHLSSVEYGYREISIYGRESYQPNFVTLKVNSIEIKETLCY